MRIETDHHRQRTAVRHRRGSRRVAKRRRSTPRASPRSARSTRFLRLESKDYAPIYIDEQVEVVSLVGDIALDRGKPKIHAHVVVAKRDGTAHGGHLLEAWVRPTLELVLVESPATLRRKTDPATGLGLITWMIPDKRQISSRTASESTSGQSFLRFGVRVRHLAAARRVALAFRL